VIVIAVANNKGGVGKTTTAGTLAAALATQGHRVLAADLDEQANLSSWYGAGNSTAKHVGAFLLAGLADMATWPMVRVAENLELLPSHHLLGESLEKLRKQKDPQPQCRLRDRLAKLTNRYDYIVLDCPPGHIDGMTFNAFCAAQVYVVATEPEMFAVEGLAKLMRIGTGVQAELNPQLRFVGFVLPRFNPKLRGALRTSMLETLTNQYGAHTVLGYVREDVAVKECQATQQTLFAYGPDSRAAQDYQAITTKLLKRI
jgi:chromosome partitioning protein